MAIPAAIASITRSTGFSFFDSGANGALSTGSLVTLTGVGAAAVGWIGVVLACGRVGGTGILGEGSAGALVSFKSEGVVGLGVFSGISLIMAD